MLRLPTLTCLLCAAPLLLTTACGARTTPSQVYENDEMAELCLIESGQYENSTSEENPLAEGTELEMIVAVELIGSSDRGPLIQESCSVELDDSTLVVNSLIEFDEGQAFDGDSVYLDQRALVCEVPTLDAGDYDVVHGENSYSLTIPSDTNLDCGKPIFENARYRFDSPETE